MYIGYICIGFDLIMEITKVRFIGISFMIKTPVYYVWTWTRQIRIFRTRRWRNLYWIHWIRFSCPGIEVTEVRFIQEASSLGLVITILSRASIPRYVTDRAQPIVTIFHRFNQPSWPRIASRWSDTLETVLANLPFSPILLFAFTYFRKIDVKSNR